MRDKGIILGLVEEFETSDKRKKGVFWGFRKMFWTYLNKLHVPFFDPCCETAPTNPEIVPAGFNTETGEFVFWDATSETWLTADDWVATTTTTTTTTTSTSTTSTTTT
jgi:hypothetical protein